MSTGDLRDARALRAALGERRVAEDCARERQPGQVQSAQAWLLPAVSRTQFLSLISLKRNHRHYPNENLTFNNTTLFIRALFWLHYCAVLKH